MDKLDAYFGVTKKVGVKFSVEVEELTAGTSKKARLKNDGTRKRYPRSSSCDDLSGLAGEEDTLPRDLMFFKEDNPTSPRNRKRQLFHLKKLGSPRSLKGEKSAIKLLEADKPKKKKKPPKQTRMTRSAAELSIHDDRRGNGDSGNPISPRRTVLTRKVGKGGPFADGEVPLSQKPALTHIADADPSGLQAFAENDRERSLKSPKSSPRPRSASLSSLKDVTPTFSGQGQGDSLIISPRAEDEEDAGVMSSSPEKHERGRRMLQRKRSNEKLERHQAYHFAVRRNRASSDACSTKWDQLDGVAGRRLSLMNAAPY